MRVYQAHVERGRVKVVPATLTVAFPNFLVLKHATLTWFLVWHFPWNVVGFLKKKVGENKKESTPLGLSSSAALQQTSNSTFEFHIL